MTMSLGAVGREVDRVVEALAFGDVLELAEEGAAELVRRETSVISTVTVPDSTLARSRMLLSRSSRSLPERG